MLDLISRWVKFTDLLYNTDSKTVISSYRSYYIYLWYYGF